MTEKFSVVGVSSSIAEARAKLSSDDYLVVTSDEGLPLTVITMADLPGSGQGELRQSIAKVPPTVIAGCDLNVSSIQGTPADYLLKKRTRAATLLGDEGVVGVVPAKLIRSYLKETASIASTEMDPRRPQVRGRTIPFSFNLLDTGLSANRMLRVAAGRTLGGRRALPGVPRRCKKCGWLDYYPYILPTTRCKNPDQTVKPQPWPHTLA